MKDSTIFICIMITCLLLITVSLVLWFKLLSKKRRNYICSKTPVRNMGELLTSVNLYDKTKIEYEGKDYKIFSAVDGEHTTFANRFLCNFIVFENANSFNDTILEEVNARLEKINRKNSKKGMRSMFYNLACVFSEREPDKQYLEFLSNAVLYIPAVISLPIYFCQGTSSVYYSELPKHCQLLQKYLEKIFQLSETKVEVY